MPVLDQPTNSTPVAKLPEIGSEIVGLVYWIDNTKQQRDIDGNLKYWDDGGPKMSKIVNFEVLESDGALIGDEPAQPGDRAAIFAEGGTYIEWKKAVEDYAKPLATGLIFRWKYDHDQPAKNPKYNARKVRSFKFEAGTAEQAARAEQLYDERADQRTMFEEPSGGATAAAYTNEEPF